MQKQKGIKIEATRNNKVGKITQCQSITIECAKEANGDVANVITAYHCTCI